MPDANLPTKQPAAHQRNSSRLSAGAKQGVKQSRSSKTSRLSGRQPPVANTVQTAQVYTEARRQATRLSRSRSKSSTGRPATLPKGSLANSKKALGTTKPKQTSMADREALFNATNITLDNYDIKQTENRSATKKEVALPKYHPAKQTLRSASSRGRSLGAGDRRSKGRNSACSLESHGSHHSNRSRPRHMVQPVRTRSRENIRIYEEER